MSKNENHITLILLGVIIIFLIIIISNRLCNKKNNNVETFEDNEPENSGVKLLNLYNKIQDKIDTYNDSNKIDSDIQNLKQLGIDFMDEVNNDTISLSNLDKYKNELNTVLDSNNSNLNTPMIEYIDKKKKESQKENSKNNQDTLDKAIKDIIQQINSHPSI